MTRTPRACFALRLGRLILAAVLGIPAAPGRATPPVPVTVDLATGPVTTFVPAVALGAGVDGHSRGDSDAIYRPDTLRAMLSAGLGPLSYRLRTELAIQAWHWNPRGTWSDPRHAQGYWTSSDQLGAPILTSYGYRLPRRGNTVDQAEDNGYSRIADGDLGTFWKSNPYLDRRYTGEDNRRHPQWLIVDLGRRTPVNALRIVWGEPYAVRYAAQYWAGTDPEDPDEYPVGGWRIFPGGEVTRGQGGDVTLRVSPRPLTVRFLRVLLEASSGSAPPGAEDPRDALGYAVRELYAGTLDAAGRWRDAVRHGPGRDRQSRIFVSSTDPWHRASDLDPEVEQPGVDRVFASGLTRGLPALMAVGALYDTPDNAAALLRYWKGRGYPLRGIEIGEEPDGQYAAPEDYGALYLQTADALRAVDPAVVLGGPSFQSLWDEPMMAWSGTEVAPDHPWLTRFLDYLRARDRLTTLGFVSFEWYPFDDVCAPVAPQLQSAPASLDDAMTAMYRQGLPRAVPLYMTEYGYSAYSTQAEVDLPDALFNADAVGTFLAAGGATAYLYGYEPSPIYRGPGCDTWGNNTLFLSDERRRLLARTATYHGINLLTRRWLGDPDQPHALYRTRIEDPSKRASPLSAYAVKRPDRQWALLLVNRDPHRSRTVALRFAGPPPDPVVSWQGPVAFDQFSSEHYRWQPVGARGRPLRSLPPRSGLLPGVEPVRVRLPPWSLTVLRGAGPEEGGGAAGGRDRPDSPFNLK